VDRGCLNATWLNPSQPDDSRPLEDINLDGGVLMSGTARTRFCWTLAIAALAGGLPRALAQSPSAIPTPSQFNGFDVGTRYIITANVIDYYRELARRSPRVQYLEYGRSIQGRPLPMVVIGSEANLARKDEIQARLHQLTNVTDETSPAELNRLTSGLPAVVLIEILDVDEEAGVNALQEVAHDLATREDEEARSIRDSVLVVMIPLSDPDAHARYVTWHMIYNVDGASTDRNAVENTPHWASNTDGNAYGIDVNRDWGTFVSPEMQAMVRVANQWHPQFWLDVHSGPPVIFLPPFPPPFHPLWSEEAEKWWKAVAQQAAKNFGTKGWSFNSREGYEGVTSPTFALSWAMLGPAVSGFLYETFGGRPGETTTFYRSDGTLGTLRMAMERHKEGIWSMLEVVRDRRQELLRDANHIVVNAVAAARRNPVRGLVVPAQGDGVDPDKAERLVRRLVLQGIEVQRATEPITVMGRDIYSTGPAVRQQFSAGSYVIDFVQPEARLARALLDPTISYDTPQVDLPYTRRMPYYDQSWGNIAFLFGAPAFALSGPVQGATEPVAADMLGGSRVARYRLQSLATDQTPYAYVMPAGRESSYRVAIRLIREGYHLRVFREPFKIGETTYPKGTWAALRLRNPDQLGERLKAVAAEEGARVIEVASPYTDQGVTFGDDSRLAPIAQPLVAVVADWPITQDHTFGGIRNILEADFGFAFTPVMLETLNRAPLSKYTAIVLPHAGMDVRGGPNFNAGYRGLLDLTNLRNYVSNGGTLIAMKGAAEFVASDSVLGRDVVFDGWAEYTNGATLRAQWSSYPMHETATWQPHGLEEVGLPLLGSGYEDRDFAAPGLYPVLLSVREGGRAQAVARYAAADRLLLDGYMLAADKEELGGRPLVIVERVGRGKVIFFAEETTFRGYWYDLNLLFLNSLLLGPLR
jgi:hypothetical protein